MTQKAARFHSPGEKSGLRHPALQARTLLRDLADAVKTRRRQRVAPLQIAESLPRDVSLARAATEPLVPGEPRVVPKGAQAPRISGDPVVREMPAQLRRQGGLLLHDREEAVLTTPLR